MSYKLLVTGLVFFMLGTAGCRQEKPPGTLRVSEENPRYFTDKRGRAVYLVGSHTWNNRVEMPGSPDETPFDYEAYLAFLESYNHNFFRLWAWDLLNWNTDANREANGQTLQVNPMPYLRTGPGEALDGKPRFDLTAFNPEYFQRLRDRVEQAAAHEMYVAVMLFEGWGLQFSPDAYRNHPFHPANNIQELPLSTEDSTRLEIYTLDHQEVTALQEAYVRIVIRTVNEFDNVLFEISNENHPVSTPWQYHMIRYVKEQEAVLGKSHPVGMTFQYRGGLNKTLFESPADWISPNPEGGYNEDPPANPGRKVIITDTDHLWGIGGNRQWVWKSFFRGLNPIFMDPYDGKVLQRGSGTEWAEEVRVALGTTRRIADNSDLIHLVPAGEIASSGYCLANRGKEYLVYLPDELPATLDLGSDPETYRSTWFNTADGTELQGEELEGGSVLTLISPFGEQDAVLHLYL